MYRTTECGFGFNKKRERRKLMERMLQFLFFRKFM